MPVLTGFFASSPTAFFAAISTACRVCRHESHRSWDSERLNHVIDLFAHQVNAPIAPVHRVPVFVPVPRYAHPARQAPWTPRRAPLLYCSMAACISIFCSFLAHGCSRRGHAATYMHDAIKIHVPTHCHNHEPNEHRSATAKNSPSSTGM